MKLYAATSTPPPFGLPGSRARWFQATQKSNVYDAIYKAGKDGLNRNQVAQAVNLAPDRISFYLSDLRRSGYIIVKGDPTAVSVNMNANDAAFAALLGLENALVAKAREKGATTEMNDAFQKYQKIKELALRPGTGPEGQTALRMAVITLVKVVF